MLQLDVIEEDIRTLIVFILTIYLTLYANVI